MLSEYIQEIADSISDIVNYSIIITDRKGIIEGATIRERIGTFHEASISVIRSKRGETVDAEAAAKLEGTYPGVTYPIQNYTGDVVGSVAIVGEPEEVKPFALIVKKQIEMLLQEKHRTDSVMNRENALQSVIYEIANFVPGSSDGEMLLLRARELGFDPQLLYVPIAVDLYHFERYAKKIWDNARNTKVSPEDTVQSTKRHILFDIRAIFNHPLDIASMIGNSRYIILCAVDPEKRHDEKEVFKRVNRNCHKVLASFKKRGIEVSLGIGFFAEGIEDLSFSYSEAWKAIFLAKKFNWGPGVFDIQKLRLEELLSTTEVAIRDKFIHDKLSKMKDARLWEELRDTVEAWCNSGFRYVTAARDLGIHRNSLEYRLSNIKKITGLDPTRFKDCISLYIALELDRYVGSVDNVHKS